MHCLEEMKEWGRALSELEKLLKSKKPTFVGGEQCLQAHCMHAMASHLKMVVHNGQQWTDAAEQSAEVHKFAEKWGGCQLCGWSCCWL